MKTTRPSTLAKLENELAELMLVANRYSGNPGWGRYVSERQAVLTRLCAYRPLTEWEVLCLANGPFTGYKVGPYAQVLESYHGGEVTHPARMTFPVRQPQTITDLGSDLRAIHAEVG